MKLGLSGRIIEESASKYQMSTEDFIRFAAAVGYQGVELRGGQVYLGMPESDIRDIAAALQQNKMACVFVSPANRLETSEDLAHFSTFLKLVAPLQPIFIRINVSYTNIATVQRAADIATATGDKLLCQIHTGTPLDSVEKALAVVAQIYRPNFGLTFEPGNFILLGQDYGPEAIKKLGKSLFQVSFQNIKPVPEIEGEGIIMYEGKGFRRCLIGDPNGVDIALMFKGLYAAGYDGFITPIEPISKDTMDNKELAKFLYQHLSQYI